MGLNKKPKKKETRGRKPRGDKSESQRVIEFVNDCGVPVKVRDIEDGIVGIDIPKKNIRAYLGKASRKGEILGLGSGLYMKLGGKHAQEEKQEEVPTEDEST